MDRKCSQGMGYTIPQWGITLPNVCEMCFNNKP
uniref:Uncharacterized protein n=1 Tax=Anguilla anguilla TaxID=7936 RepID=A0A0E9P8S2_ANGAN